MVALGVGVVVGVTVETSSPGLLPLRLPPVARHMQPRCSIPGTRDICQECNGRRLLQTEKPSARLGADLAPDPQRPSTSAFDFRY